MAVYLNYAGTSYPKPPTVSEAVRELCDASPERLARQFETIRRDVAACFAGDPEGLLFTGSCTQALDVGLASLPFARGDVIVTSHLEHQALVRPIQTLVRRAGVVHEKLPYHPGTPLDLDALETLLKAGRVVLLALSAASNVTGELLPIRDAAALAHHHGARVLVDGAQVFGLTPVDVEHWGADLFTFAAHKYPLGVVGAGGLWARSDIPFECSSAFCQVESGIYPADRPGFCDVGSINMMALYALRAGLNWKGAERPRLMREARQRAADFAREASKIPGVKVFGHSGAEQTATVSFLHEGLPVGRAEAFFRARDIDVREGTHCAPDALSALGGPPGTIRVSFGPHNTEGHLTHVLAAVRAACS